MAQVKFANNGKTTLNGAINSSVTTIVVTDGTVLPSLSGGDWFYLTLENNALTREIVKVTARSVHSLTVVRGQDGTTAASWLSGDKAENRLTLAALNEMAAAVAGITPTAAFLTLVDDTTVGAMATTLGLGTGSNVSFLTATIAGLYVSGSGTGQFMFQDTAAGTDLKRWDHLVGAGTYQFRLVNDANSVGNAVYTVTRTAHTAATFNFGSIVTLQRNGSTVWDASNDGAGSGLDADLLDGKNIGTSGNVIGLLDGVNTYSGASTFSSTTTFGNYLYINNALPELRFRESGATTDEKDWRFASTAGDFYLQALNESYASASNPIRINRTGFGIDSILLVSTALTHNGSTIWTLGNDGAGSGLDADLLDGKNTGTSGNTIPLLDGNNTWSGSNTWTSTGFIISNTFPNIQMYDSDGALNQKYWRMYSDSGSFVLDMVNDAFTVGNIVLQVARTAHTSAVVTFSNLSQFEVNASSTILLAGTGSTQITGSGILNVNSNAPEYRMFDADAGTNLKQWRHYVYADGSMGWSLVDDGYTAENFWLTVVRTAHTSAVITFPATVANVNIAAGYLYVSSSAAEPLQLNRTASSQYTVKLLDNSTIRGYWGANSTNPLIVSSANAATLLVLSDSGNTSSIATLYAQSGYAAFYPVASGTNNSYFFMGNGSGERSRMTSTDARSWAVSNNNGVTNHLLLDVSGNLSTAGQIVASTVVYAVNGFSATSANAFEPQINLYNTNNDASAAYLILNKNPADTTMTNGDTLGNILFQGRGSASVGQGVSIYATYTGTRGTNWVGTQLSIGRTGNDGVYRNTTFLNGGGISDDLIGTVWGSSNDGAGSGLDADLLDGLNATSARVASTIVARNSGGAIFVQDVTAERGDGTGVLYLNAAQTRYLYFDGSNYVMPSTALYVNGAAVWTSANDGAGSGLDADLLDGLSSASFITVNSTGLRVVTTAGMDISTGGSYSGAFGALEVYQNTVGSDALITFHCGGNWAGHFGLDGGLLDFVIGGWSWGSNVRHRIWHVGNDGSGSGLDADLLDGFNSTTSATANTIPVRDSGGNIFANYFNSVDDVPANGSVPNSLIGKFYGDNYHRSVSAYNLRKMISGILDGAAVSFSVWNTEFQNCDVSQRRWSGDTSSGSNTNGPGGSWWFVDNMRHSNGTNYWGTQIAWGWEDNANRLKTRNVTGGSFGAWVSYWNDNNDGSGSGLDADLLDGLNSATAATASTIAARDGSGQLTAADFIISSDARLKTDIYCITNALDKIEQIRGAEYTRLSTGKREIGVIAQDLEAAGLGLLVDNIGPHKSVKYQRVVAVLIEAVKELSAKVKQLEAR